MSGTPENLLLLHTANTYIPKLKHIWNKRGGHPELLFLTMLGLAGGLATFAFDANVGDFPDYDHHDLGACFTALDAKIQALLEVKGKSKCISVPLRLTEKMIWSGAVADDQLFRDTQFFLAVSAKMGVDDLIKKVPQLVKVSAPEEINNLVRFAIPGIGLRHAVSPPPAISFRLGNQYFSLNQSGRLWDGIVKSRNISLFVPAEISEAHLELLIVLQ